MKWIADEDAKRAKISDSVQGLGDKRQVCISISCSPDPITNSEIINSNFYKLFTKYKVQKFILLLFFFVWLVEYKIFENSGFVVSELVIGFGELLVILNIE